MGGGIKPLRKTKKLFIKNLPEPPETQDKKYKKMFRACQNRSTDKGYE